MLFPGTLNESSFSGMLPRLTNPAAEGAMSIEFRSEFSEDQAIVYCAGQLKTGSETDQLREMVTGLLYQRNKIILDLSQIQYIDSGALGVLVGLYSSARTAHGEIRYQNLAAPVNYIKPASFAA
jgi:anti-anti-sigma factor